MSPPPDESRRILALVVPALSGTPPREDGGFDVPPVLVTLAEALLVIAPRVEVRAPDTVVLDASAAPLFGGEAALGREAAEIAMALAIDVRGAVADGIWPARALARWGDAVATAAARADVMERRRETKMASREHASTVAARHANTRGKVPYERETPHGGAASTAMATPVPHGRAGGGHPRHLAKAVARHLHDSGLASAATPPPESAQSPPASAAAIVVAPPRENARALAPLPLAALELPAYVIERLGALGLARIGDLAPLPVRSLAARFGAEGERAIRLARGVDPTPLIPHVPQVLPEETQDLEGGVEALEPLLFLTKSLAERLAARLAGRVQGATTLALVLTQESREAHTVPLLLTTPSASTLLWMPVLKEAVERLQLPSPVVRLTLAATGVAPLVIEQLALDDHPERIVALEAVLSRLESRLGEQTVLMAKLADRHRPEGAFELARFDPKAKAPLPPRAKKGLPLLPDGSTRLVRDAPSKTLPLLLAAIEPASEASLEPTDEPASKPANDATRTPASTPSAAVIIPLRRAPPPTEDAAPAAPLRAIAADDPAIEAAPADPHRPTRLCAPEPIELLHAHDRWIAVRLGPDTHSVESTTHRERLIGEWWLTAPFDRTYIKAHLRGLGDCWIFHSHADNRTYIHGYFD